jgi:predicted enzyme related to lactoylglutathione lyase
MSDLNQKHNRAVWFDIPVVDLDRAAKFYANVLAIKVDQQKFGDVSFAVLEHKDGNGGCLVPNPDDVTEKGIMLYMNAEGRLRDAVKKVSQFGGKITEDVHPIGPHGFRAIVRDSEGNRIVLHSMTDN